MTSFTAASDVWTKGYDQAGNICWYNKETNEIRYDHYFYYDSPGHPPILPPRGPLTKMPYPHLPAGPWATPAARASAEMLTSQGLRERAYTSHNGAALKDDKSPDGKDRTALFAKAGARPLPPFPPNNATCPAARTRSPPPKDSRPRLPFPPNNVTRPVTRSKSPPSKGSGSLPPFPPNNVTRPAARSRSPPPPKKAPKKAADDQWSLQRNEKVEEYYFNTTTFDWQIETPDCLKKYTTL